MIDTGPLLRDWQEVVANYPVPAQLYDHQVDAMALLKEGKHVFLGKEIVLLVQVPFISISTAVPTGAGKTLPQLATILTMEGL